MKLVVVSTPKLVWEHKTLEVDDDGTETEIEEVIEYVRDLTFKEYHIVQKQALRNVIKMDAAYVVRRDLTESVQEELQEFKAPDKIINDTE